MRFGVDPPLTLGERALVLLAAAAALWVGHTLGMSLWGRLL